MTSDQLRADADRRERLARAATPGPWTPMRGAGTPFVSPAAGPSVVSTHELAPTGQGLVDVKHICAHDPAAALRQVERDRLLADAMDWIDRQERRDFSSPSKVPLGALLRRFAEMEAGDANL